MKNKIRKKCLFDKQILNIGARYLFISIYLTINITKVYSQGGLQHQANSTINTSFGDQGDGTYKNPILFADYSDPDVIRVNNDYYLTSSSFANTPGLPILHSKDLVNWEIIGHALDSLPEPRFSTVQHGGGVWAPSIRIHAGKFYIFFPDPDRGIYMINALNPAGPWSVPLLIKKAKGWIDPCPFWDTDGNAYLVNALAGSRSGMKSTLIMNRMSIDGTHLLDHGAIVYDGHASDTTIEGPKLYKRNGFYYILAPAGGVGGGWQVALRSKNIYGPYERKTVLEQGNTKINGPHQGALVETPHGQLWFLHFQDADAYGRYVHLEPAKWVNNWPFIGIDNDGNGVGEPVTQYNKPNEYKGGPIIKPITNDDFDQNSIGLQWQWEANENPSWYFCAGKSYGFLRLYCAQLTDSLKNLWNLPNILSQKFFAPNFSAVCKFKFVPRSNDEETGLIITGIDYSYISVKKTDQGLVIGQTICNNAEGGKSEIKLPTVISNSSTLYFKVTVKHTPEGIKNTTNTVQNLYAGAMCQFSYSFDGVHFMDIGEPFSATRGKWIGAKVGLFAIGRHKVYEKGYSDFDWFRTSY